MKNLLLFISILAMSSIFRFIGVNWDSQAMLHPDERFLVMVVEKMKFPENLTDYLNTKSSHLNPHNIGFEYYVYGTLPLVILRGLANYLSTNSLSELFIVGRYLSGFVDMGICILVFLIARKLNSKIIVSHLSMFIYGLTIIPIQLSHFFAVDPFLVLFNTASLYFLISFIKESNKSRQYLYAIFSGVFFGLAISSKISAVYVLPALVSVLVIYYYRFRDLSRLIIYSISFLIATLLVVRMAFPYLFSSEKIISSINNEVVSDWKELSHFYSHSTYSDINSYIFPPATMFLSTRPYLFPVANLMIWGIGVPVTVLLFGSLVGIKKHTSFSYQIRHNYLWIIPTLWAFSIFIIQGGQFLLYLRYFYPLVPVVAVFAGYTLSKIFSKNRYLGLVFMLIVLIWPISFTSIYASPNTRVVASDWIYSHIPAGSSIAYEHWDDPLPLYRPNYSNSAYTFIELPLFDQESKQKWRIVYDRLNQSDYIAVSSNRVYGSTTAVPDRFPITTKYYELLFSGKLGFEKITEFVSRPGFNFPIDICIFSPFDTYGKIYKHVECDGLRFVDDYSDESFTVYDHPKVIIFKRSGTIPNLSI